MGATVILDNQLQRRTELGSWVLNPKLQLRRFTEAGEIDENDWSIDMQVNQKWQTRSLEASATIDNDSTLVADFGSTGFVDRSARRQERGVRLGLVQAFSDRFAARVDASYNRVTYPGETSTALVAYEIARLGVSMQWLASERSQVTSTFTASRVDPLDFDRRSHSAEAAVSWDTKVSERTHFRLSVGRNRTSVAGRRSDGESFGVVVEHETETAVMSLQLQKSLVPTGRGLLNESDEADLTYSRQFSPRTTASVGIRAIRLADVFPGVLTVSREYFSGTAIVDFRLREQLSLRVGLNEREQRYENVPNVARGRQISLGFSWTPMQERISR
ncbi:MAG: hypothetical protein R3E77_15125 [Steroidobacteraceae bacterium]